MPTHCRRCRCRTESAPTPSDGCPMKSNSSFESKASASVDRIGARSREPGTRIRQIRGDSAGNPGVHGRQVPAGARLGQGERPRPVPPPPRETACRRGTRSHRRRRRRSHRVFCATVMAGADQAIPLTAVATLVMRSTASGGQLQAVDIAESVHIRDEVEMLPSGENCGIDMLHRRPEHRKGLDLASLQIKEGQLELGIGKPIEAGRRETGRW